MTVLIPVTECVLATEDAHLPPVVPGLHLHVHIVLNVGALGVALDNEMIILILIFKRLRVTPPEHKSQNLFSEIQDPAMAYPGTQDVPPQCSNQPVGSRRRR